MAKLHDSNDPLKSSVKFDIFHWKQYEQQTLSRFCIFRREIRLFCESISFLYQVPVQFFQSSTKFSNSRSPPRGTIASKPRLQRPKHGGWNKNGNAGTWIRPQHARKFCKKQSNLVARRAITIPVLPRLALEANPSFLLFSSLFFFSVAFSLIFRLERSALADMETRR